MAGETPSVLNPLLQDFMQVAYKLEELGFIYHRGIVVIISSEGGIP
jgi:hypothetical protein